MAIKIKNNIIFPRKRIKRLYRKHVAVLIDSKLLEGKVIRCCGVYVIYISRKSGIIQEKEVEKIKIFLLD